MTPIRLSACCALLLAAPGLAAGVTVVTASRIHTVDAARPQAEAMAFDAAGRIVALGTRAELRSSHPDAAELDLGKATIVPGLIDAHGHMLGLGLSLLQADLVGTSSKAEVIARLQAFERTLPAEAWLIGRGWDQNDWPEQDFPLAADLDKAFPKRPVWLDRVDGHAGWANSAALRKVKRDLRGDWQPDGGRIERRDGKATGVFVDGAMALVESAVPQNDPEVVDLALTKALAEAARHGLTGVHDAGVSQATLARYRKLADEGRVPIRIYAMADGDGAALAALCKDGLYQHPQSRLSMRAVKLYVDGALGSRGAALEEDYADDPGNRGLLVTKPAAFEAAVGKARKCGVQVATHAIGDRANGVVLDVYARLLGDGSREDHRWRIEHAQVVQAEEISSFATLGVIASMQPTHATSDMPWAEARVGARRIIGAYAWRTMRDAGIRLAFGSDFPVESVDPRLGLYAAVTRQDVDGIPQGGWYPAQRLTAYEALRAFTSDAAYAVFAEVEVGSLAPGRRADFVVLDGDPLALDARALLTMQVRATYVDGKPVYQATR